MDKIKVLFEKTSEKAKAPSGRSGDAGYDMFASERVTIKPFERKVVKTGVKLEIPAGVYGRIAPKSGYALKDGIDVMAGVIDPSYRGEIGIVIINLNVVHVINCILSKSGLGAINSIFGIEGEKTFEVGDKVAQIIFEKYHEADFVEANLSETERGDGGFGSTGKS